jgi:hypothetical protein
VKFDNIIKMRNSHQQVRESVATIDDIKDQLNLVVHEVCMDVLFSFSSCLNFLKDS